MPLRASITIIVRLEQLRAVLLKTMTSCRIQCARCNEPPQQDFPWIFLLPKVSMQGTGMLFEKATGMYGCSLRKALLELLKSTATYALVFSHTIYSIRKKLELGAFDNH